MASFVETQPYQFAPYIPTLPVEDMVRVGMIKQQQYDAGLQKARESLQSIANVDVIKPEHVKYVEEAFNNVKSQLKSVASQDFSNQQLVNSVAGLAKQVHSDKNIQNMLSDTAWWRKQYQNMESAIEKGESSPENQWDLLSAFDSWYGDGDATSRFRKTYSDYVDVNKVWMENLKALTANGSIKDIPFVTFTDPATGEIMTTDQISRVMTEQKIEGVSAEQIENAIRATMNPKVQNQLSISGRYTYRGLDKAGMEQNSKSRYAKLTETYKGRLADAEEALKTYAKGSSEYTRMQRVVDGYKNLLGSDGNKGKIQQELEDEIAMIQADPEAAKGLLYKNFAIKNFSDAFAWKKTSFKIEDSAIEKVRQWQQTFDFNYAKYLTDAALEERKVRALEKNADAAAKAAGLGPGFITDVPVDIGDDPLVALNAMTGDVKMHTDAAETAGRTLSSELGLNPKNLTELDNEIAKYQRGEPSRITNDVKGMVDSYVKSKADAIAIQSTIDTQMKKAEEQTGKKFLRPEQLLQGRANLIVPTEDGEKVVFTPKEVYDFIQKERVVTNPEAKSTQLTVDLNTLTNKEKILFNKWKDRYNTPRTGGVGFGLDKVSSAYVESLMPIIQQSKNFDRALMAQFNTNMAPYLGAWSGKKEVINVDLPKSREGMLSITNALITKMKAGKGSLVYGDMDLDELSTAVSNETTNKTLQWEHVIQGGNDELWVSSGSQKAKIKLSPFEAAQLPSTLRVDPEELRIRKRQSMGRRSTNQDGSVSGAYIRPSNFRNVKSGLNVYGDYVRDLDNPQINYISLILGTPDGYKSVQIETPYSIKSARSYVNGVSTADLLLDARTAAKNQRDGETVEAIEKLLRQYKIKIPQ